MDKLIEYVNTNLVFREEYEEIYGRPPGMGKIFCPFHHNVNTPAAKVYGNNLKCFSCNRLFSVYDLLKKHNPEKLERLKSTVIIPEETVSKVPKKRVLRRNDLDISKGITHVIKQIYDNFKV